MDSHPPELVVPAADVARLARELGRSGIGLRFVATGSSMWPLIRDGDVVTLEPPGQGPVPLGAVVAAESGPALRLVVHRVVSREGPGLVLRGDNAARADGIVTAAEVLGVVRSVERRGRRVAAGLGSARPILVVLARLGLFRLLNRLYAAVLGPRGRPQD